MIKFFSRIQFLEKEAQMNRKIYHLAVLGLALIIALILVACKGTTNQQPEASVDTNQVLLPVVEVRSPSDSEAPPEVEEDPYPTSDEKRGTDSYPAPEGQAELELDSEPIPEPTTQDDMAREAYPKSEEIAQKPTPRGHDLIATDPGTVNLASGQLQLVEMFAFW